MKHCVILLIGLSILVSCNDSTVNKKEQAEQTYRTGLQYFENKETPANYSEAAKLFTQAAELGHPEAQYYLGKIYCEGLGVSKDCNEAIRWFKKSSDQGSANGANGVGWSYQNGCGVPQDYAEAMKWFRIAADKGLAKGQFNVAMLYMDGTGVTKDYNEAMRWHLKAAEQKFAEAENRIGLMYCHGEGVHTDYSEAMKWYQKAANQNFPYAMMNIGGLHEHGLGVRKNLEEASAWYKKALEHFNREKYLDDYDRALKTYEKVEETLKSPQKGKICLIDPGGVVFESTSTLAGCYKPDGTQISHMIDMMINNKKAFKIIGNPEVLIEWTYPSIDYCAVKGLKEKSPTFYVHKKCLTCPRGQTIDYK